MRVAVLGATGLVGRQMIASLRASKLPVEKIDALASHRSAGQTCQIDGQSLTILDAQDYDFSHAQLVLSSAGREAAIRYLPKAVEAGAWVIDNSSAFRMHDQVPLVIPEVNGDCLAHLQVPTIIANPNCAAIQLLVALAPLNQAFRLTDVVVATYQSQSGAGQGQLDHHRQSLRDWVHQPFTEGCVTDLDVVPMIGEEGVDGHSGEEEKIIVEVRKILGHSDLRVMPTAVRVPVDVGHAEAVTVFTEVDVDVQKVESIWRQQPGLIYSHDIITPRAWGYGQDHVGVSRLRVYGSRCLSFWCVADNLRKGAATNAVQIAECLYQHRQIQ